MARWIGVVAGGGFIAALIAAIGALPARGADGAKSSSTGFAVADYKIGDPVSYGNLTIFPILSKQPRTEDPYITLDEGLKAGTVKIFETGAEAAAPNANAAPRQQSSNRPRNNGGNAVNDVQVQGDVNELMLLNRSTKPLYLMPGEIIIGGKQDRTIAQETIIPPGNKPTPLEVFCVEHGRWAGRNAAETDSLVATFTTAANADSSALTGKSTDAKQLAAKAQNGEFIGSVGAVSKDARKAVQGDKNQSKVWQKVAEANAKSGVRGESGYFTGNYVEQDSLKRLGPYVTALEKKTGDQSQIVGVAIAIDGKMDTLDVFESTPLFRHLWPKLLKSYALDAANAKDKAADKPQVADKPAAKQTSLACTPDDARKFLAEAVSSRGKKSANGEVTVTTAETEHVLSFAAEDSRRADQFQTGGGLGGAGGFGGGLGGVHISGFAK